MSGLDDWRPPTKPHGGDGIIFSNWQSIRAAIEAAYRALGREVPKSIPTDDWNLIGLAIDAYAHAQRVACFECRTKLWNHETIRCLDCKAPLCERCAPRHFWPNGERPNRHR